MKDKSWRLMDIADADNMIVNFAKCYHLAIGNIGTTARSCLGIVSVKSAQRAIDTLLRKTNNQVTTHAHIERDCLRQSGNPHYVQSIRCNLLDYFLAVDDVHTVRQIAVVCAKIGT